MKSWLTCFITDVWWMKSWLTCFITGVWWMKYEVMTVTCFITGVWWMKSWLWHVLLQACGGWSHDWHVLLQACGGWSHDCDMFYYRHMVAEVMTDMFYYRHVVDATRNLLRFCVIWDTFTPNVCLVCRQNCSRTSLRQVCHLRLLLLNLLCFKYLYLLGGVSISQLIAAPLLRLALLFVVQCPYRHCLGNSAYYVLCDHFLL